MEISDQTISVVIQGPVIGTGASPSETSTTAAVIKSVRQFLPKAEVILSTWEGTACDHIPADIVVMSKDPGAFPVDESTSPVLYNNLNRMLVSTQAGLAKSGRPFSIKLRTDTPLRRAPDYSLISPVSCESLPKLFDRRILASHIYTRHPLKRPVLFHLSDLVHFGSTSAMRTLWNIPLVDDPLFTRWNQYHVRSQLNPYPGNEYNFRCAPEQYLLETLARRISPNVFLTHTGDGRISWLFLWLRLLSTHFVIQPYENFFATLPNRMVEHANDFDLFTAEELPWLERWSGKQTSLSLCLKTTLAYWKAKRQYTRPWRFGNYGSRLKQFLRKVNSRKVRK
jgi:hypothetical protein